MSLLNISLVAAVAGCGGLPPRLPLLPLTLLIVEQNHKLAFCWGFCVFSAMHLPVKLLLVVVVLFVLLLLAKILPILLGSKCKGGGNSYERRKDFLTAAERSFYGVLLQAVGTDYAVFCKVNLADVVQPIRGLPAAEFQRLRNKIDRKHLDFVLCDRQTLQVVLAIELDDSSHARPDRKQSDDVKDVSLCQAAIKILRVPVLQAYSPIELSSLVKALVSSSK